LSLPPGPSWTQKEWDEVAAMLERAAEQLGPRYDALVVDEALDFPDDWWLPLLTLLEEPDAGILYVFHHSNQAIYRRKGALPDKLLPAERETHVIVDNLSAHKTKLVDEFLTDHPNAHLHFTPT